MQVAIKTINQCITEGNVKEACAYSKASATAMAKATYDAWVFADAQAAINETCNCKTDVFADVSATLDAWGQLMATANANLEQKYCLEPGQEGDFNVVTEVDCFANATADIWASSTAGAWLEGSCLPVWAPDSVLVNTAEEFTVAGQTFWGTNGCMTACSTSELMITKTNATDECTRMCHKETWIKAKAVISAGLKVDVETDQTDVCAPTKLEEWKSAYTVVVNDTGSGTVRTTHSWPCLCLMPAHVFPKSAPHLIWSAGKHRGNNARGY